MAFALSTLVLSAEQKFYPDDPVWKMPRPMAIKDPQKRKIDQLYDFAVNSVATPGQKQLPGKLIPAADVNTLGEVPDSTWYTNRHYHHRMSLEALKRGPETGKEPSPPFRIVAAKSEGITPGFQVQDAKGRRYLCKPDPRSYPEMATAADVIGSKFFYAFGYNVPENYIFYFSSNDLSIDPSAKIEGLSGKDRPLNRADLRRMLEGIPKDKEGRYRMMGSLLISGTGVGPFRWFGTRQDDPEDLYDHENRRALRGLHVFCSWLNHTDVKANNTYDTVLDVEGVPAIVHYLIDFGASLGSDSDDAKNVRFGHEFMIEKDKRILKMLTLGLYSPDWERADFPDIPAVGRFEAKTFVPDKWTSNYPNSAFLNRLPDDTFWAAKQVMAFTREEIRTMTATGQYSDPKALDYMVETLVTRQQKIGRYYFSQVLPLDGFVVEGGELRFEDLSAKHGFTPARRFKVQWSRLDNSTGETSPIAGASEFKVPASDGYVSANISGEDAAKRVVVHLQGTRVVGIDRTW